MTTSDSPFNFQFNQEDVEAHGKKSQWQWVTPEYLRSNNQYGIASIFKEYAGLPQEYPLRLTVEHGVMLGDGTTISSNTIANTILACSNFRAEIINQEKGAHAIPVGFGYLYAKALFEKNNPEPIPEEMRKGTLVFPSKEVSKAKSRFDHSAYAQRLKNFPEHLQPVYVCIYCRSTPDIIKAYRDAGVPVVTAGQRLDPMFFYRFHDISRRFRYSTCIEYGSQLYMTVTSGCRYFYHDGPGEERKEGEPRWYKGDNQVGEKFERNMNESLRLFGDQVEEITPEQKAHVDKYIGADCMVSPEKMRSIILTEQRKFEKRPWWHGERKLFTPPDASYFDWEEFAPGSGWFTTEIYELKDEEKTDGRWMGPTKEAWVDLHYPRKHKKRHATLKCQIHALNREQLKISVNGKKLSDLDRQENENGFLLQGTVAPKVFANPPSPNTVRIGFHASGDLINDDGHWKTMRPAAVGFISLKPEN